MANIHLNPCQFGTTYRSHIYWSIGKPQCSKVCNGNTSFYSSIIYSNRRYKIANANEKVTIRERCKDRYTFAGAGYFKRMQDRGLYTMDISEIEDRVKKVNLDNIFNQKLC